MKLINRASILNRKSEDNRNIKKWAGIIIAVIFIIFVSVVGVRIYYSPANQISRQLDLGYKYLENGEYEEAVLAFEKAIAIDDKCMEAYAGGLKAYISIGDEESLQAFYDRALAATDNLDEELLEQNMGYVVEIYQMADTVYADMPEQAIEVLEKGWNVTVEPEIRNKLAEDYLAIAEEKNRNGIYEDELKIYDRLLELDKENERALEALEKCLISYLDFLMEEERYDEVTVLAEKYREIVVGIDFDEYLEQIKEVMAIEEKEKKVDKNNTEEEETEITAENDHEETGNEPEQETDESEENVAEPAETVNVEDISQDVTWVDDLYQKILAEDADAVFAIMEEPDLQKRCEVFQYSDDSSGTRMYRLLTSDGNIFWALGTNRLGIFNISCSPDLDPSDYDIDVMEDTEYKFWIIDGERGQSGVFGGIPID